MHVSDLYEIIGSKELGNDGKLKIINARSCRTHEEPGGRIPSQLHKGVAEVGKFGQL
jgi:hypothetical protein